MMLKKKPPLTELEKAERERRKDELIRSRRTMFFMTILIWAALFLILRDALKLGGNPASNFFLMFGLLLIVFFIVRIGTVKLKFWWYRLKRNTTRFFSRFRLK